MARGNSTAVRFAPRKPQGFPTSFDLDQVRSLLYRDTRESTRLFWAEGVRSLKQAMAAQRRVHAAVVCRALLRADCRPELTQLQRGGTAILQVNEDQFASLSIRQQPDGVGLVLEQEWSHLIAQPANPSDIWVVVDNVLNPGNLGTMLRTCCAIGGKGIMLIGGETDPHSPACVRASMGAIFHQRLVRTSVKALQGWKNRHPCTVIGASPHADCYYRDAEYGGALLLMMGNERAGLTDRQSALCDQVVRLPMVGPVDSLNLAVATGVLLYQALECKQPDIRSNLGSFPSER